MLGNSKREHSVAVDKEINQSVDIDRSSLVSRNISVQGRRTSVRLEPEMWNALKEIARRERCKIHDICSLISARKKPNTSLTAAIRVFLMLYFRAAATEDGHMRAGHGDFGSMMQRARVTQNHLNSANNKPSVPATLDAGEDLGEVQT